MNIEHTWPQGVQMPSRPIATCITSTGGVRAPSVRATPSARSPALCTGRVVARSSGGQRRNGLRAPRRTRNAARSMLYVWVQYGYTPSSNLRSLYGSWSERGQCRRDQERDASIGRYQGNRNPFVACPTLTGRLLDARRLFGPALLLQACSPDAAKLPTAAMFGSEDGTTVPTTATCPTIPTTPATPTTPTTPTTRKTRPRTPATPATPGNRSSPSSAPGPPRATTSPPAATCRATTSSPPATTTSGSPLAPVTAPGPRTHPRCQPRQHAPRDGPRSR